MNASLRIYLPYSAEAPWTVRKDVCMLGQFKSFEAALSSAHVFALDLQQRMQAPVDLVIQDAAGDWSVERAPEPRKLLAA